MRYRSLLLSVAAAGSLAACNSADDAADTAAAPEPVLTRAPVATAAPDGSPLATGTWDVNEAASGAQAVFAGEDGAELLAIRCDTGSRAVDADNGRSGNGSRCLIALMQAVKQHGSICCQPMAG